MKQFPGRFSKKLIKYAETKNEKFPVRTIIAVIEILVLIIFQYALAAKYNVWFGNLFDSGANYFGMVFIGPFMVSAVCFILGIDLVKAYDMITPAYACGLIMAKIGCFCAGCCHGIEWQNGLYNYETGLTEVPVQLIETGLALCIFVLLVLIRKKAKPGTLFPAYLILYSATRFCSEFLRYEPDILGKLKLYHLLCLAGIVVGIIFFAVALLFADKISSFYTRDYNIGALLRNVSGEIDFNYHQLKKSVTKKDHKVIHHKKNKKK